MKNLEGNVAVITGASRGIGKTIALELARHGVYIAAGAKTIESTDKTPGTIYETAEEIISAGGKALAVQTDVRFEDQLKNLVHQTIQRFGRIDYIINNAGAIIWKPVKELPVRHFDRMWQVNIRASYALCHYAIPVMKKNLYGHIINISPPPEIGPLAAEQWAGRTGYLISKFAMSHLTSGLAEELKSSHIRVNSLWPENLIDTQATRVFASMFKADNTRSWYSPQLMADACLELLQSGTEKISGKTLIAEEFLASKGKFDLKNYQVPCPV